MALMTRKPRRPTMRQPSPLGAQIVGGNAQSAAVPGGSSYAYNPKAWEAAFRAYGIGQRYPGAITAAGKLNLQIPGGNTPNAAVPGQSAKPPAAPAAPGVTPPAAAAPPPSDPKDATYAAAMARALYDRDSQLAQLGQSETYDRADLAEAIRRMTEQRPQDEQRTREAANRAGLLFSGQLGKQLGDLGTDYVRRQGDAEGAFARRQAERLGAGRAAESGYGLTEQSALADAIGRQIGRDADAAAARALVPETPAAAAQLEQMPVRLPGSLPPGALTRDGKLNWHIIGGNTKNAAVPRRRTKPKAGRF